jgi:hypothetical protein
VILALYAFAADPRAEADAADRDGRYADALAAYTACAEHAADRDARYCRARAEVLAPQAADGFAGWAALEGVRRDYRALGSDAALARVEAALAASPDGPAAAEMRAWLAMEHQRRGDIAAVDAMQPALATQAPTTSRWLADREGDAVRERRRRIAAVGGAILAGGYALAAIRGPGRLRWRSAGIAAIALGITPTVLAALFDRELWPGFGRMGGVVTGAVLIAGRARPWVAIPGTLGALIAAAWWNGWLAFWGV